MDSGVITLCHRAAGDGCTPPPRRRRGERWRPSRLHPLRLVTTSDRARRSISTPATDSRFGFSEPYRKDRPEGPVGFVEEKPEENSPLMHSGRGRAPRPAPPAPVARVTVLYAPTSTL
ncbi:hypothetical protein EVAR_4804_1 [Eumeta japonica]|uniref:Uncharacterized protein n=1 Tax=Eumeta variegata TaxID=151549 RepID=A0A4C1SYV5_EUMVA|nr:hypothetical protein EVAR_4804_1 [Eumeta japonica]